MPPRHGSSPPQPAIDHAGPSNPGHPKVRVRTARSDTLLTLDMHEQDIDFSQHHHQRRDRSQRLQHDRSGRRHLGRHHDRQHAIDGVGTADHGPARSDITTRHRRDDRRPSRHRPPSAAVAAPGTDAPIATDPPRTPVDPDPADPDPVDLDPVVITGVSVGAGSGEFSVGIDDVPADLDHFTVSTPDGDASCNHRIVDVQTLADGAVIITYIGDCGGPGLAEPTTFAVSWVHEDGRRSPIAYRNCPAGITFVDPC